MLNHPEPEVQAIFGVLEGQRDRAQEAQAIQSGLLALATAKLNLANQAIEALTAASARQQALLEQLSPSGTQDQGKTAIPFPVPANPPQ